MYRTPSRRCGVTQNDMARRAGLDSLSGDAGALGHGYPPAKKSVRREIAARPAR